MKKKVAVFLVVIMAFAAILGACGGDKNDDSPGTEGEDSAVTLSITWWGGQARHDYTQTLLDKYTENNPNVTFEASPSDWDGYFDRLSVQATGGEMPDIIQMDYLYISTYAGNNTLADMKPFIDSGILNVSDITESLFKTGNVGGTQVAVPISASVLALGTNPDVLAEAGIDAIKPDWTWADFEQACLQVKERTGKYGFASNISDINWVQYWVRQYGHSMYNADGTALGFDDPSIIADFMTLQKRLVDAGAMPNPDQYAQITTLDHGARPVAVGEAAFTENWNNYPIIVKDSNPNTTVTYLPNKAGGEKGLWLKPGMFFTIAENSKHKEEAAKFIDWFINSQEANDIIQAERGVPVSSTIRNYMASGNLSDQQKLMFEYIDNGEQFYGETPAPEPPGNAEINDLVKQYFDQVLFGQLSPADAAQRFFDEANTVLARN
jgi:multiple sugar transport system substrate-binding protein